MKKSATLLLACSVALLAADYWQSKSFTDWSDKDVQHMLENSPWSKPLSVAGGPAQLDPAGRRGGGRGGSGGDLDSGAGAGGGLGTGAGDITQGGGNMGRPARGGTDQMAGPDTSISLIIRWQDAVPVKQALMRLKYGSEAGTSPEAKKVIENEENAYVIAVSGLPRTLLAGMQGDPAAAKKVLLDRTTLSAKGKKIPAADIRITPGPRTTDVYFIFPRTVQFDVDDKEVEFATRFNQTAVNKSFHLKDMVIRGKLEL